MKNVANTIDKMLEVIPADQVEFRCELESRKDSASWASPEMRPFWWQMTGETLCDYIKPAECVDGSWQGDLHNVWMKGVADASVSEEG